MNIPIIHARATNVELTKEYKVLINKKLLPLARFLKGQGEINVDVVVRKTSFHQMQSAFFVSLKVTTDNDTYMAVAMKPNLSSALVTARSMLRRSISSGESVSRYHSQRLKQEVLNSLTLRI